MADHRLEPGGTSKEGKSGASGGKPSTAKAEARQERLAAQLRENLKKRKDLNRARKNTGENGSA